MTQLQLDYSNCMSDRIGGEGIRPHEIERARPLIADLTARLNETRGTGWERWRLLPFEPMRSAHVRAVMSLVEPRRRETENLIVLGIGGSALGNIALHAALTPHHYNLLPSDQRKGPRLFVLDNVDPHLVGRTLAEVNRSDPGLKRTLVNVVSKSGETAETAAQLMIVRAMLKEALGEAHRDHIIAVTDPEKGTMRSICDQEGYATLPVPEGVGGRFSVLSPVGLFSAAMCGIDIQDLLDGAAEMDAICSNPDLERNPAAMLAWLLMTFTARGKGNHVLMPYWNSLYLLADWFRQLWAESLGKREDMDGNVVFAGATPIKALGTTDQHSQVQLYREGPNDKVIGFIDIQKYSDDVQIPSDLTVDALKYLHGATLGKLLQAERRATEYALVESERPNFRITFPKLTAYTVGQFIQMWEIATSYAGLLLHIDAYNQPAVETGKVATFGLMGRKGYAEWKKKVDERLVQTKWVV